MFFNKKTKKQRPMSEKARRKHKEAIQRYYQEKHLKELQRKVKHENV